MSRRKSKRQIFEQLEVIDAGAKGKTIAKAPDGRVVFLSNAVPGDVIDVQTHKKRKAYFEGKAIKFHKLSEKRATPKCVHFGVCGGCKWQHMSYEHQLHYKQQEVTNNLVRLGHLELPEVTPILGSKEQYFYRNKMEFSFSDSRWLTPEEIASNEDLGDRNALGFHIPGMWDKILDIDKCWLQTHPSNAIRNEIKQFAIDNELDFFNTRQQTGLLRTLMLRTASTGDLMVLIQFYKEDKTKRELLLNHLVERFPEITSLQYVINGKANDTIYDQDVICYHGNDHIFEEMEGLRFKINAKSFYQTNSEQAYELYKITRDFAGLSGDELVYDLYTGTGTIAQFVAKKARHVVGVEAVPDAIAAAKENAQLNNIDNVDFFVGDMKSVFNDGFIKENGHPDVIITDPPRDGMHKDVVNQILNIAPKRIVYVSCNSATQARDLALLKDNYEIIKTQAVDMFPQTHHVENVVLLEQR
ncbi:23S rRNA (uracil(1939)-C(5))-methyltransferase RlmD [Psychroserpens sp.]|uniref:23S rRNA (uracil(1939)-C(5))-methyltransferase RlmD n=1 Tax=Psychroserpens sp. TaxID=2020870 RepID=UPI001B222A75|nr:23S rRNA (uracil(1939)-C(5))-methyltransferase RlmD [Psychroserpens sp.]MBO6607314.1 23S rRNA (uracil(1939)-C(5))-methyltransferase RlmD [Psychroserpens sp.]MBO6654610.1 23S rRNA (uracil(1939)-C(5))-methyltransferase RlmD [Psychroserpens sp.]MBO6681043.1 23S rRNA (uracil(1939)-C(5))-methyltransferase RlmD [Psychroserpens sp.]MBO6750002.1 23S rRNA (uracil(1939)-C(5))-methyltransferase RlmD [Psychroserpens sp.]MBO6916012.1 23S rRNA (uracil(1939)-C(5))-methyltransferase RlmD [Psychroserpens sp